MPYQIMRVLDLPPRRIGDNFYLSCSALQVATGGQLSKLTLATGQFLTIIRPAS